jgi:hypothetical protein
VDGITKFVFGREVVDAAQAAFAEAPTAFPDYLHVPAKPETDDEPNRALEALKDAAKAVSAGVSTGAAAVGTGVATAAGVLTRPFRSVDLDGDGVPEEPQALSAVKGVRNTIASAAGAVGDAIASRFRPKERGGHSAGDPQRELESGPNVGDPDGSTDKDDES